jgi:lysophospholipase L1-like esterase
MPTPTHPEVTDDRVFLVGDSITESIGPRYSGAVCHALEPLGWNVTVDAFMGRTTAEAVQSLRSHLSSVGQVVVILIGHNDSVDPTSYRAQMTRLLDLLPDVPRVLLLTNYEFERGRDRMNQVLRDLAAIDPHIQLVDWNLVVQGTKGAIRGDGLHLTSIGEEALSDTIASALGAAPVGDSRSRTCTTFRNPQPSSTSSSSSRRGTSTTTASSDTSSPTGSPTTAPPSGTTPGGPSPTDAPPTTAPPTSPPSSPPPHRHPPGTSPPPPTPPST